MPQQSAVSSTCVGRPLAGLLFFLFSAFIGDALTLSTMAAEHSVREFDITIRNAKIERDFTKIRVKEGDHIIIQWSSDASVTVHLEGYDISVNIGPGRLGKFEFDALITGRFPIHMHASNGHGTTTKSNIRHSALSYLEVHPK